jgi:hypothetical protein
MAHFKTPFEQLLEEQVKRGLTPFRVFKSSKDWGLTEYLMRSGNSKADIWDYLALAFAVSFTPRRLYSGSAHSVF